LFVLDELRGLEWGTRYQIIKGICAGLHYLHMEKYILHMDLKPANILLDNQMVPKITDFGLSRPMEISQTMTTHYFSSPGYGAPENQFGHGTMSVKSDMYSLGAIIIELVTGQKGIPDNNNNVLRRWRHSWNKSSKETPLEYYHQVTECIEIGKLCLNLDPHTRPSISQVMNKFVEMESTKINPIHWEDDMLGVEPLELLFRFNKEKILSCSVELSNDTDGYIAFKIETTSPLPYSIEPTKDIVKPRSKFSVDIKLPFGSIQDYKAALQCRSSNERCSNELIVQSFKVNEGLTSKDINKNMFDKHTEGHHVDEIHLVVVSEESCSEELKAFLEKNNSIQLLTEKISSAMIPLHLIKTITDDFAEKNRLGGGNGYVYKGVLNGQEIAVKRLFPVHVLDEEAFTNEFRILRKVQHKNIVRLLGYCYEITHRHINHDGQFTFTKVIDVALCFEFMEQGSLSQHLSADSCIHDWPTTFKIIKGTCEAIDYLHRGRGENNSIYHLDLKPDNILMDKNMVPKIGDFGLSRLFNDSATHQTTTAKGTM
jgi:serine/threonine protein kinase